MHDAHNTNTHRAHHNAMPANNPAIDYATAKVGDSLPHDALPGHTYYAGSNYEVEAEYAPQIRAAGYDPECISALHLIPDASGADIASVWVCDASRPYLVDAMFERIA